MNTHTYSISYIISPSCKGAWRKEAVEVQEIERTVSVLKNFSRQKEMEQTNCKTYLPHHSSAYLRARAGLGCIQPT